jgi:tRNA-splicing ligase RtcB
VKSAPAAQRAEVRQWLVEARLPVKVQENLDRLAGSDDVRRVVVLPDVHLGRLVNNGCVAATVDLIYPQAVGSDLGCGYSAIGFSGSGTMLREERHAQALLRAIYQRVPAFKQSQPLTLPDRLLQPGLSHDALARASRREGAYQLGTLGTGNHFLEFQQDDAGALWLMVHSGSRALGQIISQHHLAAATPAATGLKYLAAHTPAGQACLNDLQWAVEYAKLNRLAILARMVEAVAELFGVQANEDSYLDSPHNYVRRETIADEQLFVHRKSANSARMEETSLIAGTMGTPSFVVQGLGAEASLCSCAHGAGRVMSRTEARQRIRATDLKRQLGEVQHDPLRLEELRDEAPAAYRDLREVLRAQRELARQQARLTPLLNFKYPDREDSQR